MSKMRLYLEASQIKGDVILKDQQILHKIKNILRLKVGEQIYVFNGTGEEYLYRLARVEKGGICLKQDKLVRKENAPKKRLILAFPLLKEDKIDFILQKATELGALQFSPFICERSLSFEVSSHKMKRWKKIIMEAVRQSEQLWFPQIRLPVPFKEILSLSCKNKFVAHPDAEFIGSNGFKTDGDIFIAVGPEGGFSSQELADLKGSNFNFVRLSANILRVETACIFFVGLLNYFSNAG